MRTKSKVIMETIRDKGLSSDNILSVMSKKNDAFHITIDALRNKGLSADEILDILNKMSESMYMAETDEKENKLRELLLELGIPRNIAGYHYLVKAVILYHKAPEQKFTRDLYPAVAEIFETTDKAVERAIRHAIECAWNRVNIEVFDKYFKNTISAKKGKPTSSELITMCSEWLSR